MGNKLNLSRLIPKNHFCSFSFFREEPLINWTFTKSVLFTAYDVYRNNDFWLDSVIRSGSTLKEAIVNLGFPKSNTLIADTGVFEIEARKAGIARELGIEIEIELSNAQIFEAYEISGADFFVSPDEIVLPVDSKEVTRLKVEIIKENLLELLEIIHPKRVIAVIQGNQKSTIDELLDFYRENGLNSFAMGGVIPLYHYDKKLLEKVLKYVREVTQGDWLHIFGLPNMRLLSYYLHDLKFDSVDTSMLLYLSARRHYLVDSKPVQVRTIAFEDCGCKGCMNLVSLKESTRSAEFLVNLYIHNIVTAARESKNPTVKKERKEYSRRKSCLPTKQSFIDGKELYPSNYPEIQWMTAEEALSEKDKKL